MEPEMKKVFDLWWKDELKTHEREQFTLKRPHIQIVIEDAFIEGWAGGVCTTMEAFGSKIKTKMGRVRPKADTPETVTLKAEMGSVIMRNIANIIRSKREKDDRKGD